MSKRIYELHAEVCKALAHPLRIEIIEALQNDELSFTKLAEITDCPKSNLSQHLSNMTQKGILRIRKDGLTNYYRLSSPKVAEACFLIREVLIENFKNHKEILDNL